RCPGKPLRQGQLTTRPYCQRKGRPADLGQIRGRSRQVSALGLYVEGGEVLRSAGRLFDRSDRKGRTDHEGRGPSRCPIAERGDGQGEDFFERGGREGAWGSRRLPRGGGGSHI